MVPTPGAPQVYQLKVVLRDVTPLVWRRLLVASTTTIADLHASIQIAMGWEDLHLHQFRIYGKAYGVYRDGGISFADDPHQVTLADFRFRAGERLLYEYDFGDGWQHDIWLERILPRPRTALSGVQCGCRRLPARRLWWPIGVSYAPTRTDVVGCGGGTAGRYGPDRRTGSGVRQWRITSNHR